MELVFRGNRKMSEMKNGEWFLAVDHTEDCDSRLCIALRDPSESNALIENEELRDQIINLSEMLMNKGRILAIDIDEGTLTSFPADRMIQYYEQKSAIVLNTIG